jgi:hypothetical protein
MLVDLMEKFKALIRSGVSSLLLFIFIAGCSRQALIEPNVASLGEGQKFNIKYMIDGTETKDTQRVRELYTNRAYSKMTVVKDTSQSNLITVYIRTSGSMI